MLARVKASTETTVQQTFYQEVRRACNAAECEEEKL